MAELEMIYPQSKLIIIPIIDVSGAMAGEKMATLNDALAELPAQLMDINDELFDTKILIAPMEFSTGARWFALKNGNPAEVESFRWIDMKAGGLSDLGAAYELLYKKLTTEDKGGWMSGRGGVAPILILVSGGFPTDDYQNQLKALKSRGWFKAARKFAVAVEGADKSVLEEFTGNPAAIIDTTVIRNNLATIIRAIVVSASKSDSSCYHDFLAAEKNEFDITAFKCGDKNFEIVCKITDETMDTRLFDGYYYLVKKDQQLFVARVGNGRVLICDYERELFHEIENKLFHGQIQIKEVFFRKNIKQIYVVYVESNIIKCTIVRQRKCEENIVLESDICLETSKLDDSGWW